MKRAGAVAAMVGLVFLALALGLFAASAHGAVNLPFINNGGWVSTVVFVNPSGSNATVEGFWAPTGVGAPDPILNAHQVFRFDGYPMAGGGVFTADFPLLAPGYMEIHDPNGKIARVGSLAPVSPDGAELADLLGAPAFKSYLFLSSQAGSAVTVDYFQDADLISSLSVILGAGETQIPEVPEGANRAEVHYGIQFGGPGLPSGPVFAMALISHQPAGELLIQPARNLEAGP